MIGAIFKKMAGSAIGSAVGGFFGSNLFWIVPTAIATAFGGIMFHLWQDSERNKELELATLTIEAFQLSDTTKSGRIAWLTDRIEKSNEEKRAEILRAAQEVAAMREAAEQAIIDRDIITQQLAGARTRLQEAIRDDQEFADWADDPYPSTGWNILREATTKARTDR